MRRRGGGFSLTELMVVLGIIAILASLLLGHAVAARARAHEATCMSNLKQLLCAIQLYAADYDGRLLPRPRGRVPGCETPDAGDEEAREAAEDAASRYLLGGYAPYGASMDTWHCPSQPWPRTIEEGRAFIEHARRTGGAIYAGMGNPYYRTYYYTWLERLAPEEARLSRDEQQSTFQIDYLVCDSGLLGAYAYEPFWTADGNRGERSTTPCPHGDRRNWRRSRTCIGFLDGHVESLTPGEWDRRRYGHFAADLWREAVRP
jgi:prepilin-type N-terminal cleavage/methylation domain-containing protein